MRFEFQQPYFGREGPGFWRIEGEPSRGGRYIVEATIYGEESIATALFEAVDERGAVIQPIGMVRLANGSGTSDLIGVMVVPNEPFRVVVRGEAVDGQSYQRTCEHLFRPTHEPPSGPKLPPGTPPELVDRMTGLVDEATREAIVRLEDEQAKHPGGLIVMPRSHVTNVTYVPFLSGAGRPLGVRVAYDVEFSEDGLYNPWLHVAPADEREEFRGLVSMEIVNGSIEPMPKEAGSPQVRPNVLAYGAGYLYKGNTTYHFTADLIPDFVIQNEAKTKYCIYLQKFKHDSASRRAAWTALSTRGTSMKYSVRIDNVDFRGEIGDFPAPGVFFASFAAEGAQDCGDQPTRRF